jgi:hypothetical protein
MLMCEREAVSHGGSAAPSVGPSIAFPSNSWVHENLYRLAGTIPGRVGELKRPPSFTYSR